MQRNDPTCPDCGPSSVTRRDFLRTTAGTVALAGAGLPLNLGLIAAIIVGVAVGLAASRATRRAKGA